MRFPSFRASVHERLKPGALRASEAPILAKSAGLGKNRRMWKRWISISAVASLALGTGWVSCRDQSQTASSSPSSPSVTGSSAPADRAEADTPAAAPEEPTSGERTEYRVEGVVKDVIPEKNRVRIAHEEIPDYMPAMTMLFDVKDPQELEDVKAGDKVRFLMVVTRDDGWIEEVQRLGEVSEIVTDEPSSFRLVRDVDPLTIGDPMPDYTFTNEMGQVVSLSDYEGKALALTFIFTRCPFPTFCPRMSAYFQSVYKELQSMDNAPENWHLFSVTIDPQYDTPQILKNYAQAYTYDPERWNYLTGKLIDITAISEQFGLQFYRPEPENPSNLSHNLRTVVIDAAGRVSHILVGNEWEPRELAQAMVKAARVKPESE